MLILVICWFRKIDLFFRVFRSQIRIGKVKGKNISFSRYSEISPSDVTLKGDIRWMKGNPRITLGKGF